MLLDDLAQPSVIRVKVVRLDGRARRLVFEEVADHAAKVIAKNFVVRCFLHGGLLLFENHVVTAKRWRVCGDDLEAPGTAE